MTEKKEWRRLLIPVMGIGLLFAILSACTYFLGGIFWHLTLGMLIVTVLLVLIWWILSPSRMVNYILGTLQLENYSSHKLPRMKKVLDRAVMADGGLERIMNWKPEKIGGAVRIQMTTKGTAAFQIWADDRLYFFFFRRNIGTRGKTRWILDDIRGGRFGGEVPGNALPANSFFCHGKAIHLGIAIISALAAYGVVFLLFGVGSQDLSRLKGIALNSAQSLQTGEVMVIKEGLPEDFARYQQAVAEVTEELAEIKKSFDRQMTAIDYSAQLQPETLTADRDNGLSNVMSVLEQGYAYAVVYYEDLASAGSREHVKQAFDTHQVPEHLQSLFFKRINHFELQNVDEYITVYHNAVRLGSFLQEHLDQWGVGENGQLEFSDEAVMREYNLLYAEIQKQAKSLS